MFSEFSKIHRDIVRQIKQGPPLPGCTKVSISPRFVKKLLYIVVHTDQELSRHMLALPELQYPLPLYKIATQLYGYAAPYIAKGKLAIKVHELLSMAHLASIVERDIQDLGPVINEEEQVIFVPLVDKYAVDPKKTPNMSPGQLWRYSLDTVTRMAMPGHEEGVTHFHVFFVPETQETLTDAQRKRVTEMSVGWSFYRLAANEVAPFMELDGTLKAVKKIVSYSK